jgi:hypothetical protein
METIKQADMDANPEEYLDRCAFEQPDGRIIAMVPEDQFKDIESDDDYYKNYNHTDI